MGVLTGDHMQEEREATIAAFRAGTSTLLVATDVAARGLDVPGIARVICFDFPSAAAHLHRVGRTGRAGAAGVADLLFTRKEARHAARAARGKVPPCLSPASVVPQLRCHSSTDTARCPCLLLGRSLQAPGHGCTQGPKAGYGAVVRPRHSR